MSIRSSICPATGNSPSDERYGQRRACAEPAPEYDFPRYRTQLNLCEEIAWSTEMLNKHPGLIDACREVVTLDGNKWARFDARFMRVVESDGLIQFGVHGQNNDFLETVLLRTKPGQVAYINQRPVPFKRLLATDRISLYMPENEYGFTTAAVLTPVATIEPEAAAPVEPLVLEAEAEAVPFAAVEPLPILLPTTASVRPWIALSGILLLITGARLSLRRYRQGSLSRLRSKRSAPVRFFT